MYLYYIMTKPTVLDVAASVVSQHHSKSNSDDISITSASDRIDDIIEGLDKSIMTTSDGQGADEEVVMSAVRK